MMEMMSQPGRHLCKQPQMRSPMPATTQATDDESVAALPHPLEDSPFEILESSLMQVPPFQSLRGNGTAIRAHWQNVAMTQPTKPGDNEIYTNNEPDQWSV